LIKQEAEKMPILNDIMDHEVIGPAIREGLELGRAEGRSQGRQEVLRRQLEKRFGALPKFVESRLGDLSASQLDDMVLRVLDATRIEKLFPNKQ
jgi:predicted transposase YdaD